MKKLLVLGVVLLLAVSAVSAELAEVKVGKGDLKIGAILQSGFNYSLEEDDPKAYVTDTGDTVITTPGRNGSFSLNRARLLLSGTMVPDKVTYFVQTEFVNEVSILDYKMILHNYIPQTTITIGRFLPNFTYYMPRHTGQLDFINYPLMLHGGVWSCTPWRQVGFQTDTQVKNFADWVFNLGVFNGSDTYGIDDNNTSDFNDAKDVLLRVDMKKEIPASWINVGLYAWLGNLLMSKDEDLATTMFGGFAKYMHDHFTVLGEILMKTEEQGQDPQGNDLDDISSMAFYAQAEYKVNEQWGVLARFDTNDPNTDSKAKDDAWTWITLGVNHYIDSWNAMVYLNYVMKMEETDWGATETIKNDVVLFQFQVSP